MKAALRYSTRITKTAKWIRPSVLPIYRADQQQQKHQLPSSYDHFGNLLTTTNIRMRFLYTSSHMEISKAELLELLTRHNLEFKENMTEIVVKTCPSCHDTHDDPTNQFKLNINKKSGCFHCFRCDVKGSWHDLKRLLGGFSISNLSRTEDGEDEEGNVVMPDLKAMQLSSIRTRKGADVAKFLEERGLQMKTAATFNVSSCQASFSEPDGSIVEHTCISFPWFDATGQQVRFKLRSITDKKCMRIAPKGGKYGLFGYNLVTPEDKEIVISEGEFDAMAIYQATGRKCLSLPNGARSLPPAVLPLLEQFEKIYLWLDDDKAGREGVEICARKLGAKRCYIVETREGRAVGPKDANDALKEKKNLNDILSKAKLINDNLVLSLHALRSDVVAAVRDPLAGSGVPYLSLPRFSKLLMGHRRGELSIYTGRTGMGKTTFLSQLSLDLAIQGVPTLWGSFEIRNARLAAKMLKQFSKGNAVGSNADEMYNRFEELPLYFLSFFGATDVAKVIDAMDFAVYKYDIEHVIIDNLQFMTGGAVGTDRFDKQDEAVSKFRSFASTKNVHVSLVVHPRKEDEGAYLTTNSVFGTAKATQEADNVVIIQTDPKNSDHRFIDVRKNRFNGRLGKIDFLFSSESLVCEEKPETKTQKREEKQHAH